MDNRRSVISLFFAVALLLGCWPANAQRGGARPASPARGMRPVQTNPVAPVARRSVGNQSYGYGGTYGHGAPFYGNGWPSTLGFVNAGQSLGIQAAINPATQLQLAFATRFLRENRGFLGTGGYYLLDGGGAYVVPDDSAAPAGPPQQPQPQVVVLQQAPPPNAEPSPQTAAEQPPLPDEGEFTLVRKDGKQIQAAAFTQSQGEIVYIAPDGTRHIVATSDLDLAATNRINEERGTPQLHL